MTEAISRTLRASSSNGWITPLMNSMTPRGIVSRAGTVDRIAGEMSFARHLPKDLAQEERVALRHFVQPSDQRLFAETPHAVSMNLPTALSSRPSSGKATPSRSACASNAACSGDCFTSSAR